MCMTMFRFSRSVCVCINLQSFKPDLSSLSSAALLGLFPFSSDATREPPLIGLLDDDDDEEEEEVDTDVEFVDDGFGELDCLAFASFASFTSLAFLAS